LGAAASLLVAVGGTLLVQRSERAAYRPQELKAPAAAETPKENALKSTAPKTEPPAAAHQDKLDGIAAPLRAVPQNQPTQGQATASGAGGRQRSAEATADLAPGVAVAPEAQAKARAARPDAKDLEAKPSELNMGGPPPAAAPAQPAPAPAGAFARTPAAETRAKKEARQDAGDATHGVNLGGVAGGDISRSGAGQSSDVFGRSLIPPTWKVTATGPDRYQVKATWGPGGQLYLLKRHEDRAEVLIPIREITYKDRTATWYDLTVTGTDVLDLYLLPTAPKDPTSLPAEGPVQGFRARVWPEQKKSP
ncbi:MAG TPA: hypothetical protein VJ483_03790, partial [Holophagaceae bacterium]|nr:hypothetical protein [Holophagaceae bacterium]